MSSQQSASRPQDPTPSNPTHDPDSDPMVYTTPKDYATSARASRARLLASGTDPASIILSSELRAHIPRREGESGEDYVKRYSEAVNKMIDDGVMILNDEAVADQVPDVFMVGGRVFDLGPGKGVTKGEYREFREWIKGVMEGEGEVEEVPERWRRFEKVGEVEDGGRFKRVVGV